MPDCYQSKASSANQRITLSSLKEQLYTLNMRMLLAIQNHNEETQEDLKKQMARLQTEIQQIGGRVSS